MRCKFALLFGEILRPGAAEAVYRLFYVPDEEKIFPADEGDYALLHGIYILILVDEHLLEARAHLRLHAVHCKKFQCEMLQITVVEFALFALQSRIFFVESQHEIGKSGRRARCGEVIFELGLPVAYALVQFFIPALHIVAKFEELLCYRIFVASGRLARSGKPGKGREDILLRLCLH